MTLITWDCLRCVQELATILGPQNRTHSGKLCGVTEVLLPKARPWCARAVTGGAVTGSCQRGPAVCRSGRICSVAESLGIMRNLGQKMGKL